MEEGGIGETMILCLIMYVLCVDACGVNMNDKSTQVELKNEVYPVLDIKDIMHKYQDNFDELIFPKHNTKLTQYCSIHRHWEDIKAYWTKNHEGNYEWQYYVVKNKMSHKMRRR